MKTSMKYGILVLALCSYFVVWGQRKEEREVYWSTGINGGFLGAGLSSVRSDSGKYTMERHAAFAWTETGRGHHVIPANSSIGIHTGILWKDRNSENFTSIQVGIQQNRSTCVFQEGFASKKPVEQDHDADDTGHVFVRYNWMETYKYINTMVSVQRFLFKNEAGALGGPSYWYLKGSFGQSFLQRNLGHPIRQGYSELHDNGDGTLVAARTVSFNANSYVAGAEIGFRAFSEEKGESLDIGISCFMPLNTNYIRNYTFIKDNTVVGRESIALSGTSIMLNATYSFNPLLKPRDIDSTEIREKEEDKLVHARYLLGRKVHVQEKMHLNAEQVVIRLWDKGKIDGDIISLYVNGEEVLHEYTLARDKKEIVVHLRPGINRIVLHAINLGRVPPNTAAMEVDDGYKPKVIILNSDMNHSGALEINNTAP
ncbi:MAG: hypothetical protein JST26_14975 [Bacteroidetes bacterium]|nr:hypothetical protein [Bacteroidota bacterium]